MRKAGWYIVQVRTGSEQVMCQDIQRACKESEDASGEPLLRECFSPQFVQRQKLKGQWVEREQTLLPGYLVAVTTDPVALFYQLRTVMAFTKLLNIGEALVPLREDERAWLAEATKPEERIVPISIAYREGDKLVVTDGPLKGREAMVKRIIRKKCLAQVELHVGGKRVSTTVGLAVMPKKDALQEAEQRNGQHDASPVPAYDDPFSRND